MNIIADKLSVLGNVSIIYSTYTKKFYVSIDRIEIKKGNFLNGINEQRDTPEEAIVAYFEKITDGS